MKSIATAIVIAVISLALNLDNGRTEETLERDISTLLAERSLEEIGKHYSTLDHNEQESFEEAVMALAQPTLQSADPSKKIETIPAVWRKAVELVSTVDTFDVAGQDFGIHPQDGVSTLGGCPSGQQRYANGVTGHGKNIFGGTLFSYNVNIEWCQLGTIQSGRVTSTTGWTTLLGWQYQYAGQDGGSSSTYPGVFTSWAQHRFDYLGGFGGSVNPCLQAMGLIGGGFGHDDGCYLWVP